MTRANTARRSGDEFQARLFWLEATKLLDSHTSVSEVAWESGPRGLDDIRVVYDPPKATPVGRVHTEYIQSKWHVRLGEFGFEDLTDPGFINATSISWLKRAWNAFHELGEDTGVRFRLITNWRVSPQDPLHGLIRTESWALDVEKLFQGKSEKSSSGKVRANWRAHLGIDENALQHFVQTLSVTQTLVSLEELRDDLDQACARCGLNRVPDHGSAVHYDDLIFKLHQQGPVSYTRPTFQDLCRIEKLFDVRPRLQRPFTLGIRSFVHPIDALEDRCDALLDLVPEFDGRYLRPGRTWDDVIVQRSQVFLREHAKHHESLRLVLDAHASIALSAGRALNVKSGRAIELEQRIPNIGRRLWRADDAADSVDPLISEELIGSGIETAVAISITHDVVAAAKAFCLSNLPGVGRLVILKLQETDRFVRNGAHAWRLVEALAAYLRASPTHLQHPTHLFAAAPNAVLFFLGQQLGMGTLMVYEWDFEGLRGGGYTLGAIVK
jgi:hypothetical protein